MLNKRLYKLLMSAKLHDIIRSRSAPRQRLNFERPDAVKRYVHGYWDEETISENGWPLQANFSTIAYQSKSLDMF